MTHNLNCCLFLTRVYFILDWSHSYYMHPSIILPIFYAQCSLISKEVSGNPPLRPSGMLKNVGLNNDNDK